jgi:hypothetical protein
MNPKPKTLPYRDALASVERRIVDALPEVVDGLIARAKEGDTKAAVYLCDRILGRSSGSKVAPGADRRAAFTEEDCEDEQTGRTKNRDLNSAGSGAKAVLCGVQDARDRPQARPAFDPGQPRQSARYCRGSECLSRVFLL